MALAWRKSKPPVQAPAPSEPGLVTQNKLRALSSLSTLDKSLDELTQKVKTKVEKCAARDSRLKRK